MQVLRLQRQRMRYGGGLWGTLVLALLVLCLAPTFDLLVTDPDDIPSGFSLCDDDDDATPLVSDAIDSQILLRPDAGDLIPGAHLYAQNSGTVLFLAAVLRC